MSDTRQRILAALDEGPVTGPALACALGITRAAVWKQIEALRSAGFEIESTGDGYVLESMPRYGEAALTYGLEHPTTIEYHEVIDSTNARARELAAEGAVDVAVVANEQRAGRGRLNRTWVAPPGGIYLSLLVRPSLTTIEAPILTMAAAVATVEAVQPSGVEAHIKWPNDVMTPTPTGEEKLAGILTEVEGEADRLSWAIVGVGINANVPQTALPTGATSLQSLLGQPVDRRSIVQRYLDGIYRALADRDGVLPAWRDHAATLGRFVRVRTADGVLEGTAVDVEPPGVLVIETATGPERIHAGDCEHVRPVTSDD